MQTNNYSIISSVLVILSSVLNLGLLSQMLVCATAEHTKQNF